MKLNKQTGLMVGMGAIGVLLYNVILFVIAGFEDHEASFWISYAAMMVCFIACAAAVFFCSSRDTVMCDWFLGLPILRHTLIYVIAELVLSTIFIALDDLVPWAVPFIIQFILLCVFLVLVFSCLFSKNVINEIEQTVKTKTSFVKLLHVDAQMLCELCPDAESKKAFSDLAEAIRYSDPMSSDLLAPLEGEIQTCVMNAKMQLSEGDVQGAMATCNRAMFFLKERNLKCKALK